MRNMGQAYAAQILFSRECINAKNQFGSEFQIAMFHGVPYHFHLRHAPQFALLVLFLLGVHIYSLVVRGGVKYVWPV